MTEQEIKNYFRASTDAQDLKRRYIELIKKNHPDKGGSVEVCQLINSIYDKLVTAGLHSDYAWCEEPGPRHHKAQKNMTELSEKMKDIISKTIVLDGLKVEMCGTWLWVSGTTYNYYNELHDLGMTYHRTKRCWYYHEGAYSRAGKYSPDMDQIREKYGTTSFSGSARVRLSA